MKIVYWGTTKEELDKAIDKIRYNIDDDTEVVIDNFRIEVLERKKERKRPVSEHMPSEVKIYNKGGEKYVG